MTKPHISNKLSNQTGMVMVAILLSMAILVILYFVILKPAPKKSETQVKSFATEAGIDTSSQLGILESSKKLIKDAEASRAVDPTADMH